MPHITTLLAPFSSYQQQMAERQFVKVLAHIPESQWTRTSKRRWICARLGILSPLLIKGWNGYSLRGGVVYAEALAAYGQLAESQKAVTRLLKRPGIGRYQNELIYEFSKYNLPLAIKLIDTLPAAKKTHYHQALKLVYLHTQYQCTEDDNDLIRKGCLAYYQLQNLNRRYSFKNLPDLLLLNSNWQAQSKLDKLAYLNQYQAHFNLPKFHLKSQALEFNSFNIELDTPIRHHPLSLTSCSRNTGLKQSGTRTNSFDMSFKVTIIVTVYNGACYLESTLRSLLNQSWCNVEVIVVDDASTDDSLKLAKHVAMSDSRLMVLSQQSNQGTYVAKNRALAIASGSFLICHDADDWAHPLKIEMQIMPLLLDNRLMATTSSWIKVDNKGDFVTRTGYPYKQKNPSSLLFRRQAISLLYRTNHSGGIWQAVRTGADSELHERFKLIFGRESILHIDKPLTIGAERSNSLMNAKETGTKHLSARIKRLTYWETWRREHIKLLKTGLPVYKHN